MFSETVSSISLGLSASDRGDFTFGGRWRPLRNSGLIGSVYKGRNSGQSPWPAVTSKSELGSPERFLAHAVFPGHTPAISLQHALPDPETLVGNPPPVSSW